MLVKRELKHTSNDLHVSFRPCVIDEFVGQEDTINIIRNNLRNGTVSHTQMFNGEPGCGKTTAARIIALGLNCEHYEKSTDTPCLECRSCKSILNHNNPDVLEINVGQQGGKDYVDSVVSNLDIAPMFSRYKVLIFDEAHALSTYAQDLLLKIIEDGYSHVYFIFCTNKPEKLKKEFYKRCSRLRFNTLSDEEIFKILKNVAEFEAMDFNEEVLYFITEECKGIPRDALVWLKQVNDAGTWTIESAKNIVGDFSAENDPNVIELCRLVYNTKWEDSVNKYKSLNMSPETVRLTINSYFTSCLIKARSISKADVFSRVIDVFSEPVYEPGKLGDNKIYNMIFKAIRILKG